VIGENGWKKIILFPFDPNVTNKERQKDFQLVQFLCKGGYGNRVVMVTDPVFELLIAASSPSTKI
jgi:hypothetical protein